SAALLESVACYGCGRRTCHDFISAQDDLTGKPGTFHFVRCMGCGLVYQNPRVTLDRIVEYYDDEYIAHRRKRDWGLLTPLFERAMNRLDVQKRRLVERYVTLSSSSQVLDVGCAAGTFLAHVRDRSGATVVGIDFKDLSSLPSLAEV